jgi:hypothetical protein
VIGPQAFLITTSGARVWSSRGVGRAHPDKVIQATFPREHHGPSEGMAAMIAGVDLLHRGRASGGGAARQYSM